MQVYSWKHMECTRRLAGFFEINFSDKHAICLRVVLHKPSFEEEEEEKGDSKAVWLNRRFSHPSLDLIHPVLQCVVPSQSGFVQHVGGDLE